MAIIDAHGLFLGDRLAWCSDEAQLHWTRLYAAANNYARLELNYKKIVAHAYASFKSVPTEVQFWKWVKEYRDNFLMFVYSDQDGNLWGQWMTSDRYLLGKKNAADKRSPAPPQEGLDKYRKDYIAQKTAKSLGNQLLADLGGVGQSSAKMDGMVGIGFAGVGVGVGVGEKQIQTPEVSDDPSVAARVLSEKVGNTNLRFQEQCSRQIVVYASQKSITVREASEFMARQWEAYNLARDKLNYPKGSVQTFFESGTWHDQKLWPWKQGQEPKERRYLA